MHDRGGAGTCRPRHGRASGGQVARPGLRRRTGLGPRGALPTRRGDRLVRGGDHGLSGYDWKVILDFADREL